MSVEAKIRGSESWQLVESTITLDEICAQMKSHGFKVVRGEQGERRVINPHTGQCECIYRNAGFDI